MASRAVLISWLLALAGNVSAGEVAGGGRPALPEPMVFDLVRPLGAARGEMEVNVLSQQSPSGPWSTSPEIEYVLGRGYAVEFELPLQGHRPAYVKAAVQATLGSTREGQFIHGWQLVGVHGLRGNASSADLLYLSGWHLPGRWSALAMNGVRRGAADGGPRLASLHNGLLAREVGSRFTIALEVNMARRGSTALQQLWMPQLHMTLPRHYALQVGVGRDGSPWLGGAPVASWRLIRQVR